MVFDYRLGKVHVCYFYRNDMKRDKSRSCSGIHSGVGKGRMASGASLRSSRSNGGRNSDRRDSRRQSLSLSNRRR